MTSSVLIVLSTFTHNSVRPFKGQPHCAWQEVMQRWKISAVTSLVDVRTEMNHRAQAKHAAFPANLRRDVMYRSFAVNAGARRKSVKHSTQ